MVLILGLILLAPSTFSTRRPTSPSTCASSPETRYFTKDHLLNLLLCPGVSCLAGLLQFARRTQGNYIVFNDRCIATFPHDLTHAMAKRRSDGSRSFDSWKLVSRLRLWTTSKRSASATRKLTTTLSARPKRVRQQSQQLRRGSGNASRPKFRCIDKSRNQARAR